MAKWQNVGQGYVVEWNCMFCSCIQETELLWVCVYVCCNMSCYPIKHTPPHTTHSKHTLRSFILDWQPCCTVLSCIFVFEYSTSNCWCDEGTPACVCRCECMCVYLLLCSSVLYVRWLNSQTQSCSCATIRDPCAAVNYTWTIYYCQRGNGKLRSRFCCTAKACGQMFASI